jgi:hypothetical protein
MAAYSQIVAMPSANTSVTNVPICCPPIGGRFMRAIAASISAWTTNMFRTYSPMLMTSPATTPPMRTRARLMPVMCPPG